GLEPEETNSFLQLLAKAVLKKVDPTSAVKKVLAGEHHGKKNRSKDSLAKASSSSLSKEKKESQPPVKESAPKQQQQQQQQQQVVTEQKPNLPNQKDLDSQYQKEQTQKDSKQKEKLKDQTLSNKSDQNKRSSSQPSQQDAEVSEENFKNNISSKDLLEQENKPILQQKEDGQQEKAQTIQGGLKKQMQRPASARPPPPKIRANKVVVEEQAVAAPIVFQENNQDKKEEEEDDFIVVNNDIQNEKLTIEENEKHGGLVRKILENKKDLEGNNAEKLAENNEKNSKIPKDKLTAKKEIDSLRDSIQMLCRSTNPLGKTLDYIQEDVDGMNKELNFWINEGKKWNERLEEEIKITNEEVEPIEIHLKNVEEKIADQLKVISVSKGLMLQNEISIQKLMRNIIHPVK
ncbi:TRAF3-interacting protein 1, partial [Clydaea vesicula]